MLPPPGQCKIASDVLFIKVSVLERLSYDGRSERPAAAQRLAYPGLRAEPSNTRRHRPHTESCQCCAFNIVARDLPPMDAVPRPRSYRVSLKVPNSEEGRAMHDIKFHS